ncbi:MAG TPA: glyoxalase, partial [Thermoanaerobaculia bacterium]
SNPAAAQAPRGALALDRYTLRLPDARAVAAAVARVERVGVKVVEGTDGPLVRDPSGNAFELVA